MNFNLDFKALAYPASNLPDPVSPCQCSLVFRCDAASKQATVLLVVKTPTARDIQSFVLQYDADKLLSGTVSLSSGSTHIPRPQLDELMRDKHNKHSDIKTLALSLEQPCLLWCPDCPSLNPKPGCESAFRQLVGLAKATTIHIVFDYKHLRKEHQGMFRAFSKAARGLVGYPVAASLIEQGLRRASWDIFSPVDAVEAPPAYEGSRKRPRQASPSSPSRSPKRFAPQSPTESYTSEKTVPLSPAAAEALERALRDASSGFDFQAEAINAAVSKQLPIYLQADATNAVINAAIETQLPAYLDTKLPSVLQTLLAGAPQSTPSSPATSFNSLDSSGNRHPKLRPLMPLAKTLIPHLRTHLTEQFHQYQAHQFQRFERLVDKKLDELENDAYDARAHERAELMDEMEEQKACFSLLKEDVVKDLEREADAVLERSTEEGRELSDALDERLWDVYADMCERVKKVGLQRLVACEVRRFERRRRKGVRRGVGRRMGRGELRLLGRRRQAEDVEWVDC